MTVVKHTLKRVGFGIAGLLFGFAALVTSPIWFLYMIGKWAEEDFSAWRGRHQ